jgi:hypothetical protein
MIATVHEALTERGHFPEPRPAPPALLLQRIRAEFLEMPGLTLTVQQAARLWGLPTPQAETLLTELLAGGFLVLGRHGSYERPGCRY